MDDLSERDLSNVPDEDLTPEERDELQRRMDEFVERMQLRRLDKPGEAAEPKTEAETQMEAEAETEPKVKRLMRWDPEAIARRH